MTTAKAPVVEATNELGDEIVRLIKAAQAMRAQIHAAHPDSVEWAATLLLVHLVKGGPQRASALAAHACVDPSTVSRQVADLVARGQVERLADPDDGRATLLAATAAGHAHIEEISERRNIAFARMVADWPQDDVRTLARLLHQLNETLLEQRTPMLDQWTRENHR